MPIYEYRCRACGDTFEQLRSFGDADAPAGCTCGQADTVRLPSLIARGAGGEGGTSALPLAGGAPPGGAGGCCGGGCCS